jgi:hypothetical protein
MSENKQSPDLFMRFITIAFLALIAYNIYMGATIEKVGIPGLMVDFKWKEDKEEETTKATEAPEASTFINPVRIEAENYNESSAHVLAVDGGSSRILGYINDQEWTRYDSINLGAGEVQSIMARVASAESGGTLEIRLDDPAGTLIGMCNAPTTGGWENWQTITCDTAKDVTDFTSIYFVFKGSGTYLFNLDWVDIR